MAGLPWKVVGEAATSTSKGLPSMRKKVSSISGTASPLTNRPMRDLTSAWLSGWIESSTWDPIRSEGFSAP
ncbi:hypothetical protein D3C78_1837010 [compost metagenome]